MENETLEQIAINYYKKQTRELRKEICYLDSVLNKISIILEKNKSKLSEKDYNYCFELLENILIFRINRINNEVLKNG